MLTPFRKFLSWFSPAKPFKRIKFFFFKEKTRERDKMVSRIAFELELERPANLPSDDEKAENTVE